MKVIVIGAGLVLAGEYTEDSPIMVRCVLVRRRRRR
jgi:hypothetical protein